MPGPGAADDAEGPFALSPIGYVRSPYQRRFGTAPAGRRRGFRRGRRPGADSRADPRRRAGRPRGHGAPLGAELAASGRQLGAAGDAAPGAARAPRPVRHALPPIGPNPIGLSAVRLVRVEGCDLHVKGIDLIDGTPILDLKPYVPYADAFPQAKAGWIDAVPRHAPQFRRYEPEPQEPDRTKTKP